MNFYVYFLLNLRTNISNISIHWRYLYSMKKMTIAVPIKHSRCTWKHILKWKSFIESKKSIFIPVTSNNYVRLVSFKRTYWECFSSLEQACLHTVWWTLGTACIWNSRVTDFNIRWQFWNRHKSMEILFEKMLRINEEVNSASFYTFYPYF